MEGKKAVTNINVLRYLFFFLGLIPWYFLDKYLVVSTFSVISSIYAYSFFLGLVGGALIAIIGLVLLLILLLAELIVAKFLSYVITYKVCRHERFARQFAADSEDDKRWKNVIRTK